MKSYQQHCGVAAALDVIGRRWSIVLVRDLLPGPRRFSDLLLPGLTRAVLSQRLKELEADGLVQRVQLPPPAARSVWGLTDRGRELEPVVLALGRFGAELLPDVPEGVVRLRWFLVSLGRRYAGSDRAGRIGVIAAGEPYHLIVSPDALRARDGEVPCDVEIRGTPAQIVAAFSGQDGGALVQGDRDLLAAVIAALSP